MGNKINNVENTDLKKKCKKKNVRRNVETVRHMKKKVKKNKNNVRLLKMYKNYENVRLLKMYLKKKSQAVEKCIYIFIFI